MSEAEQKGWCVLELMGHRKLAGYVSEDEGLLRIDVYDRDPEPPQQSLTTVVDAVGPSFQAVALDAHGKELGSSEVV